LYVTVILILIFVTIIKKSGVG